ncbi:MAG: hypothetical protein QXP93_00025 [Nitrososphaerota archaeon]
MSPQSLAASGTRGRIWVKLPTRALMSQNYQSRPTIPQVEFAVGTAKVDVLWGDEGRLLDSGTTGNDGRFTSGRIPAGLDVVVRASYGQHAVEETATGRTSVEIRMPFVLIGGVAVEPLRLAVSIVMEGAIAGLTAVKKLGRKT